MSTEELQQLARQLSRPEGEQGIAVAAMMHETNISMTRHALKALRLSGGEHILELGHGNGAHIPYILEQAQSLQYSGLELSELMHTEAKKIKLPSGQASFSLYEGTAFPFPDTSFDKAFTVNTIYFWKDPLYTLNECYRVLRAEGVLCITFGEAAFMQQLPFTQFGFTLYSSESVAALAGQTGFTITGKESETERIKSKTGESMDRTFTSITMKK